MSFSQVNELLLLLSMRGSDIALEEIASDARLLAIAYDSIRKGIKSRVSARGQTIGLENYSRKGDPAPKRTTKKMPKKRRTRAEFS